VLHSALGGGGLSSLRSDPLGKSFAQILLEMPIDAPPELLRSVTVPDAVVDVTTQRSGPPRRVESR